MSIPSLGLAVPQNPTEGASTASSIQHPEGDGVGGFCPAVWLCRAWGDNLGDSFGTPVNIRKLSPGFSSAPAKQDNAGIGLAFPLDSRATSSPCC